MTKDNSFEMIPGVKVTEANDFEFNHGKRLDISKYKQFDRKLNLISMSDQAIRDKIGKNKGWAVCSSWSDATKKQMQFKVLINAHEFDIRTVNYDDICKELKCKSFTWSKDMQMIDIKK